MDVGTRMRIIRLIDKMERDKEYSKHLDLENWSTFHGKLMVNGHPVQNDEETVL